MASEHDSSSPSRDLESKRTRDRFFHRKISTSTESQIPKSEQSHDSRARSSDRESKRKRDILIGMFKSHKSTITTDTESQISESEQNSNKIDFKPSSSRPEKSKQVVIDNQNSIVDQIQSLPQIEDPDSHSTASDANSCQSQYLWMHAYKALENRDSDLVAAYARYLDPARNSSKTPSALEPEFLQAVIEERLQDNEAKKLVFHLGKKSIPVREQGEKIIKFILWSNDLISEAVSAQPYAALAWSGVSILLSLLLSSSKQKEAMLTGLSSITDLVRIYNIREKLYLQAVDEPAHPDFVKAIVELYTDIFEYQARLILYLSQSSVKRGVQGTFEWDDWNGMLNRIRNSDARCNQYTALFDKDQEHRFYAEQSQSAKVQKRILEMFEAFEDTKQRDRRDDEEARLFQTLASSYKTDKDSISTRVPGTCEWVLKDKRLQEWRDSKKSNLLWISAGPGCGKSVLSRCLIDEKQLCTNVMTSTVCYFFFKDGQEQRSKGSNAISAILHQLLEKKSDSSLLAHALSSYKRYGPKLQDEFSELWDVLIKSARDPDAGEIICVLDALDECEKKYRNQLVKKLVGFLEIDSLNDPSIRLKFLVTSRPYDDLELGFQTISSLDTFTRFDGDEKSETIGQEIHLVIDAKVPNIARGFSAEDCKSISDRLKRLDNRTYLWLFLTMNIVEESLSKYSKMSSLQELLSSLPSSVSDAYENILSRCSDKDNARILLEIVVAARRPLTLEEANIALSVATQRNSCKSHEVLGLWPQTSFKSIIQNMCGLFISVYESEIFLIHQTAREFLISRSESQATNFRKWEGSLKMSTAHGTISQICLHYLNLQEFAGTIIFRKQLGHDRDSWNLRKMYPFLDYAATEWPFHYTSQDSHLAQNSRKLAGMLCRTSLAQLFHWSPIYCRSEYRGFSFDDNWTDLGIASQLGVLYVVEDLLNEGADVDGINGQAGDCGTALIIASAEGHKQIVEMLLNHNANVNADSERYGTVLIAAAAGGHERIVEMLLNHNANVNAHNANVNADSECYGTALTAAAAEGHERIVEMLLNHNANVNADSKHYGTALIAAAAEGHERIVEMLLNQNANVNAKNGDDVTALIAAADEGHERIVEMLLNQNANVDAESGRYGTALIAAASQDREKVVEMLLNQNANVNAERGVFGTALIAAAVQGHERIVEMLLSQNANVNAESGDWGTALIAAADEGHERIVEMLLNQNANVNAESEEYGTALIAAANKGHERIVEMLLNQNANVNAQSGDWGTALIAAAASGREKVVEMLLNQNAKVDAECGLFGTALIAAADEGHEKVVEMLLDRNAIAGKDVALEGASAGGHEKVIEILLRRDPDIDFKGVICRNALEMASEKYHIGSVEMLLDKMVSSNVEVEDYDNALEVVLKVTERNATAETRFHKDERSVITNDAMIEMLRERKRKLSTKTC